MYAVLLNRRAYLADVLPPDILDRAWSAAVDTFGLGRANDDVLQRRSARKDEDSV